MTRALVIALTLCSVGLTHDVSPSRQPRRSTLGERIAINDNRASAGTLRNGVLTIRLEARTGDWHPDGNADAGITVAAFAEAGKPPQIPGPLIRVPRGTSIRAFVRNGLRDSTLFVHGLYTRGARGIDTLQVNPGQVREVRFDAGVPGTYYYWATTSATGALGTRGPVSQLNGAFIVDSAATLGTPRDRVFVLGFWTPGDNNGIAGRDDANRFVINGKSWPHTERLAYTVGDTVRFRIVNTSVAPHPMHLHGFYFNVDTRGSERSDTAYAAGSPHFVVTERVAPGRTSSVTWVPERAGNWLFHCHDNYHTLRNRPLDGTRLPPEQLMHVTNHARDMMGGLVMGIEVRASGSPVRPRDDSRRRRLRLIARVDSGGSDTEPAYGYVLQDGNSTTPARSPLVPGPTIILERGEPVSITVVNELPEATAVHWHGIELESYYDGVAGFSGGPGKVSPAIAPRDSFVARFTPPRAGTFIYHPHADEVRQQEAGLYGALLVLDNPGAYDPAHDIVLLVSTPRRQADGQTVFLNGTNSPPPLDMRVGERYRLRLVDIHTYRPSMVARLMRDSTLLEWRALAKDGRDLPPDQATMRPALQQSSNGETYDFEFTPTSPGDLRFTMSSAVGVRLVSLPIRVR
ncbi:MAG TPA: multicopper oxidase domain-containing protein [Gemmatimonadaceae bacterium]|nr:multicopper oxidase domain-containing protein [Gemmatimonadaceae bacterium]